MKIDETGQINFEDYSTGDVSKAPAEKVLELPSTDDMLAFQAIMSERFSYKPMPKEYSKRCREIYRETLPSWAKIEGDNKPLYSTAGTLLCKAYDRIVIGDYGAFIEVKPSDMLTDNLCVAKGQEYRYTDRYKDRIKYYWLTAKDGSNVKVYQQLKGVTYADYQPDRFYISPFEASLQERTLTRNGKGEVPNLITSDKTPEFLHWVSTLENNGILLSYFDCERNEENGDVEEHNRLYSFDGNYFFLATEEGRPDVNEKLSGKEATEIIERCINAQKYHDGYKVTDEGYKLVEDTKRISKQTYDR